ncbi:MAG TPA: glycosyltransferase [Solirubrobacteraceae bacterium]
MAPAISVVVPVRDGAASLPALLSSLDAQTLPADRFEVVIVDNGSRDDETARVARAAGAVVCSESWSNRARARNVGVAAAASPLIAFTDADCRVAPGWLDGVVACLEHAPLVAGPVLVDPTATPGRCERLEGLWRFDQETNVRQSHWAASANLGARRAALETIGGFDPAYLQIGEDVDLCLRARAAGYELAYCAAAVVHHDPETRLWPILTRAYRHGWSSNQHHHRLPIAVGWRYWRHPLPAVRGDWALRSRGGDPHTDGDLVGLARVEYAARVLGSACAELRRAR